MEPRAPTPLKDFAADAKLDAASFQSRHGDAFLLIPEPAPRVLGLLKTQVIELSGGGAFETKNALVLALAAWKPPVTIGRARQNSLVLHHPSVSALHAVLTPADARPGGWAVHDTDSKNGTLVDGNWAPPRGFGPPLVLESGRALRLGGVELLFVDAVLLAQLASREAGAR